MNALEKRPRKLIKKLLRLFVYVGLVILIIPLMIAGLLLIPSVQHFAVQKAVGFGGDYLETEVSLGALYLEPFRTIRLDEVLIKDQRDDTLLYVHRLRLDLTSFNRKTKAVAIDYIELDQPYFNLYKPQGDSTTNLQFILDAFATDEPDTSKVAFSIACDEVEIRDLRFKYDDFDIERNDDGMVDFSHIDLHSFSGAFNNVHFEDSLVAEVSGLHFNEGSGLELRCLNTTASLSNSGIRCKELQLVTNRSWVMGMYQMTYNGFEAFSDFFNGVRLEGQLDSAFVHFNDVGYFAQQVNGMLTPMYFSGTAYGPLSDLRAKVDQLNFAKAGRLEGKVRIKGLPDPQSMRIDAEIRHLDFTMSDFEQLAIPTGSENKRIPLPAELHRLGRVHFHGEFMGFINDFVTFGAIQTDLGNLAVDVNLKTGENINYSGSINSNGFHLDKVLQSSALGMIGFNLQMEGREFNLDELYIKAKGKVNYIDALDYRYKAITLDGEFKEKVFEGNFSIDDENAQVDFVGKINLKKAIPQISCVSRISGVRWAKLNLIPADTFGVFTSDFSLNMEGGSIDDLHGNLEMRNTVYENKTHLIELDSISLVDQLIHEGHDITLTTDLINAHFVGNTNLKRLPDAFLQIGQHFAPEYFTWMSDQETSEEQFFDYQLSIQNDPGLIAFIHPDLTIQNPINVEGKVRTASNYLDLKVDTVSWRFGSMVAKEQTIEIKPERKVLRASIQTREFSLANDYFLENLEVYGKLFNDSLLTTVYWDNQSVQADSGAFEVLAYRSEAFPLNVELNELYARIAGVTWSSYSNAHLQADSNQLIVRELDIRSKNGNITCNGKVTNQNDEHLYFDVKKFNLAYLTNFGLVANKLSGEFNGSLDVYSIDDAIIANSSLNVDSLVIDDLAVGHIDGVTNYNSSRKALEAKLDLDYQGTRNITLIGEVYPFRDDDQLDIEVILNDFRAGIAEPFISSYASNIEGVINGSISIQGNTSSPKISGALTLTDFEGLVQYLNTTYSIPNGTVNISDGFIGMDYVPVYDEKGEVAYLNASVFHDNFKDFTYDLYFEAENFLALNTNLAQNEDYYGQANISGSISISGYAGQTDITVEATTNKNTKISIPLQSGDEVGDIDYIRFLPPDDIVVEKKSINALDEELQGLNLDFQLSVNDKADVQIIFDEKIGDIIKVRGDGDMLLQIDNRGTFNMYGDYTMSGGDYLFTLQNVVNKRFSVQPGSKIVWNGSPTEAQVDLTAVYDLRAAPINLTASVGDTSEVYRKRMPVDVFLNMRGELLEPTITFDVSLPSLPESDIANQLLDPRTMSDQDMNQQVFALLLTNNFFNSGNGVSALSTTQNTTYEMVSNQFSNWISQYFDNVDVGVMVGNQTELNVSTELFNDRVLLEVNGSVQGDDQSTEQTNNVAGEFNIEYKINEDGSLRARVFNEANNYNPTNLNQSPYTQGLGVFYRKEFDTFLGLIKSIFSSKKKNKKPKEVENEKVEKEKKPD